MNVLLLLLIFVPTIIITAITPYITRKTESFGISIPAEMYHNETFAHFRKKYALLTSVIGVVFMIIMLVPYSFVAENVWAIIFTVTIFTYLIGSFFVYLYFHNQMKKLKAEKRWHDTLPQAMVMDTSFNKQKKTYSNRWFLLPLLLMLGTVLLTFIFYDKFPERLPMHYDLQGNVTDWSEKSVGTLLMFPLIQLFMTGLFFFTNFIISSSKQQIDPANPTESMKQNLIFRRRWSLFTIISGTLIVALFSFAQLTFVVTVDSSLLLTLVFLPIGAIVIGAIVLTILTGQGGSRVKVATGKNGEKINRDDDRYWKLGVFYFNPEDPGTFVEKRFGSGWTMNMARPLGWIFLIVVLLIPLAIALLG
ncbi:DUF1648 domain-containing protein [Caldibacillus lycopersici]|uniref:DUF1648 domain-containing protein n=1 Tax=Perspicuibacillus lycopersici TaxID=1325689 RepID=A0AAE3ITK8_9BACI|nr:DUF5808 domain-containing protein [Perspicuibacillus lycopersici]MCU9613368.1 DUF1648 domain-containing protein [Perspicuibacillus lycopersici]